MCHNCIFCGDRMCYYEGIGWMWDFEQSSPWFELQEDYQKWFLSWFTDRQRTLYICEACLTLYGLRHCDPIRLQ